jgi:hypothetical protein
MLAVQKEQTSNPFLSQNSRLPRNITRTAMETVCEFGSWDRCVDLRKPERNKDVKSNNSKQEFSWTREPKPKLIQYEFKHFTDCKRYIEQYRYEHTYGFSDTRERSGGSAGKLAGGEGEEKLSSANGSNPSSANKLRSINRVNSDSSILELAHKYKLAPSALREARQQATKIPAVNVDVVSSAPAESSKVPCPTTTISCLLSKEASRSAVISLPPAPSKKGKNSQNFPTPAEANGQRPSMMANGPPLLAKGVKHLPANGYAIDSTSK